MWTSRSIRVSAGVFSICSLVATAPDARPDTEGAATDATQICPILTGSPVPSVTVRSAAGESVDLAALLDERPTLLIFYRGGWCPFCNRHLGEIQGIARKLSDMGLGIVGLSPDRPELLQSAVETHGLTYSLYSDSKMSAARAFGLSFRLSDEQYERLKAFGSDLEADSGETHHELPVPAAFIVGRAGSIVFSHVNPDYRVRVDAGVLLAAASAALAETETP